MDEDAAQDIFLPHAMAEVQRVRDNCVRFVHYTSAESALKILRSKRMLLRNSVLMNDFSEVQHGMACLAHAWGGKDGLRLKALMQDVQPDLPLIFENNFNALFSDLRSETYLLSISEHGGDAEDAFGRLSMWRAYARKDGVAFVMRNTPFVSESNALQAFTSPVVYRTPDTFLPLFEQLVNSIESRAADIRPLGGQWLHETLMLAFRFAVQSTKHPSFAEEREWRVIYTPSVLEQTGLMTDEQRRRIPSEVMCLGGVPQRVYAIPFADYPEEGFVGATIPALLDRILIGPSQDAYVIAQAIQSELIAAGVAEPRVEITGIPLRH